MDPLFGIILGFVCYPVAVAILRKRRKDDKTNSPFNFLHKKQKIANG
jgi:hypothetical protein